MDLIPTKITICGGGNGAQTLLPIAARRLGVPVDIYAPYADEADRFQEAIELYGGIELSGVIDLRAQPHRVSGDPTEVVPGSELVFLVMPAFAHESTLEQIVPYLEPGAWVGAVPARGGFDYCADSILKANGRQDVGLFGLQTLPWACRILEYGRRVQVLGVKQVVDAAARPAAEIDSLAKVLEGTLGLSIDVAENMMALTLANTGQLIHPGIMYALFGDWDGVPFGADQIPLFYHSLSWQGAEILAGLSAEVGSIRSRLGHEIDLAAVRPLKEWLLRSYGHVIADASSLQNAFLSNKAYSGLKAPVTEIAPGKYAPDLHNRYLAEDVPFGLAVSRSIAHLAGLETPLMDKVIAWAGDSLGIDLIDDDQNAIRRPQKYGLQSLDQLLAFAHEI